MYNHYLALLNAKPAIKIEKPLTSFGKNKSPKNKAKTNSKNKNEPKLPLDKLMSEKEKLRKNQANIAENKANRYNSDQLQKIRNQLQRAMQEPFLIAKESSKMKNILKKKNNDGVDREEDQKTKEDREYQEMQMKSQVDEQKMTLKLGNTKKKPVINYKENKGLLKKMCSKNYDQF